ncbi:MAG: helix-turn-helix domain-containing protein [Promethearchaeota archaeon]
MWLKHFQIKNMMEIFHHLRLLLIFNCIAKHPEGITFYQIQQINHIPHSKVYRVMNHLTEQGYLHRKEVKNELGRPKYLFFLTPEGELKQNQLRADLNKIFTFIQVRFPRAKEIDFNSFLQDASLEMWQDPISEILKSEISKEKKRQILQNMYEDTQDRLKLISKAIAKLEADNTAK